MSKKSNKAKNMAEIPLMILTNERTPQKGMMLMMLYKAASIGQLAYMDGMDPDTGEIVPLLVGLGPTDDGKFNVFPLARVFNKVDTIPQYLVPDGQGSYIDYSIPNKSEPGIESVEPDVVGVDEREQLEEISDTLPEREEDRPPQELGEGTNLDGGTLDRPDDQVVQ